MLPSIEEVAESIRALEEYLTGGMGGDGAKEAELTFRDMAQGIFRASMERR